MTDEKKPEAPAPVAPATPATPATPTTPAAVTQTAQAAPAKPKKPAAPVSPIIFVTGSAGGRFVIRGEGFGQVGSVKFNGKLVATRFWSSTRIEGALPEGTKPGEVEVIIQGKTARRGQFKG
jgi:hypothetical protein